MDDTARSRADLIAELQQLRRRVTELEAAEAASQQAEALIRESEARCKAQYQALPLPTYTWQYIAGEFTLIDFNEAAAAMTAGKIAGWVGEKASKIYQDQPGILVDFVRCFVEKSVVSREMMYQLITTGEWRNLAVTYVFVPSDLVLVHTEDITARIRAEEKLRKSQQLVERIADTIPNLLYVFDLHQGYNVYLNEYAKRFFGHSLETIQEWGRAFYTEIVHPDDLPKLAEFNAQWKDAKDGQVFERGYRLRNAAGEYRWIHSYETLLSRAADGTPGQILGTGVDVTTQKEVEFVLRESRRQLQALFDHAMDAIILFDDRGCCLVANPAACELLGYSQEALSKLSAWDLTTPASYDEGERLWQTLVEQGKLRGEFVLRRQNDSIVPVEFMAVRSIIPGLNLSIIRDISARKAASAALHESETRFRTFMENSPVAAFIKRADGQYVYGNQIVFDLIGTAEERLIGRTDDNFFPPDMAAHIAAEDRQILETGDVLHIGERSHENQGQRRWFYEIKFPIPLPDGETLVGGIALDITRQKEAEERLRVALAEKETLLRELYHRTKNNMQVICALMDLQVAEVEDQHLQTAFKETQNRIQSMALVHQKLYQSQELSQVNLGEYISDLTELVSSSYRLNRSQIAFTLDLDELWVSIDTAIPCGLILNELVSNALKHGFPNNRGGEIRIRLCHSPEGEICLQVADNGVGVPAGFDFQHDGRLGLRTIRTLGYRQLRGRVTFDAENGVTCRVQFKDDHPLPRT